MKAKRAKKSPLVGMDFDEALMRLAQTNPAEVKPPPGKKRKKAKVSFEKVTQPEKGGRDRQPG